MNLYSFSVQSPCQNNGGCSQLCVLTPHGRTCICGAGMKLAEDGISCKSLNLILLHLLHLLFLIITFTTCTLLQLMLFEGPSEPHLCFCFHLHAGVWLFTCNFIKNMSKCRKSLFTINSL